MVYCAAFRWCNDFKNEKKSLSPSISSFCLSCSHILALKSIVTYVISRNIIPLNDVTTQTNKPAIVKSKGGLCDVLNRPKYIQLNTKINSCIYKIATFLYTTLCQSASVCLSHVGIKVFIFSNCTQCYTLAKTGLKRS